MAEVEFFQDRRAVHLRFTLNLEYKRLAVRRKEARRNVYLRDDDDLLAGVPRGDDIQNSKRSLHKTFAAAARHRKNVVCGPLELRPYVQLIIVPLRTQPD